MIWRFPQNPIIRPNMDDRIGDNINGPSLIRVPEWLSEPLGRYYLYFAHHRGTYIRLSYADELAGPWQTYTPGVLDLSERHFTHHIASPDVHVDHEERRLLMYFHGLHEDAEGRSQETRVSLSPDGKHSEVPPKRLGNSYFRIFRWRDWVYALVMPGEFRRSRDGLHDFEEGPMLFTPQMRHSAVVVTGDRLEVYYSNAGDCPERILRSSIDLNPDWMAWQATEPEEILRPEMGYEGAGLPLEPSMRGPILPPVHQLRDPGLFHDEDGRHYLLYGVAGERGLAIAEIDSPERC